MTKKYCDVCKKDITDNSRYSGCFSFTVWEGSGESHKVVMDINDTCKECYDAVHEKIKSISK